MPELPEVETTRRGVAPHLEGASITAVAVREPRLRWPVSPELAQMATGQRVHTVSRRAKYLIVHLERGAFMIHLGMSGSLRILPVDAALQKHDHIDWVLDSGQLLRYRDPRRFGSVFWLPDLSHPLLDSLGPEPLSEAFSAKYLYETSRGKQRSIKGLIMDAKIVVGVGNIYANEALYRSGIRPTVLAGKISLSRYLRLVDAIKAVLAKAIDAGGTSLRDFLREDGTPGYFRHELKVYGREGEPCDACGSRLKGLKITGRATVYCAACQR
jgi:formamidopyrimidine-DNA glycosylase